MSTRPGRRNSAASSRVGKEYRCMECDNNSRIRQYSSVDSSKTYVGALPSTTSMNTPRNEREHDAHQGNTDLEKQEQQRIDADSSPSDFTEPKHPSLYWRTSDLDLTKQKRISRHSLSSITNIRPLSAEILSRDTIWESQIEDVMGHLTIHPQESRTPTLGKPDGAELLKTTHGMSEYHEYLFIFNVCLAQIFSLAALSQSLAPLLIISQSFGVDDPGQLSWYTAAYSMTLGTFILPAGRLGDMYGHKRVFVLGWIWFAVWSFFCGFSYIGGPIMLSTFRGLQGIGPALLVPNGIAMFGKTFPVGLKRGLAIAMFGGCGPVGITIGSTFSALIAELAWWPWCFWVMAIACGLVAVLTYFVVPSDGELQHSQEHFDFLGAFTGVTGLLLINFALNQAPLVGWEHAYCPVLLVVGLIFMALFVYVELKVAEKPIVPLRGLHRDAALTLACIAAGWASHGIWLYYLFLLIENIRGQPALIAAAQLAPVSPIGFSAAVAVPFILKKIRVPYLMSVAMIAFILGTVLLATAPANQTYWLNTFFSVIIMPFAMNWSFPSGTILMSNAVSKQHQGIAASLVTTMVNYSIATGLGFAGSINRYLSPRHGVFGGYRDAWYFGIALAVLGFVISLYFIWQTRTKRPHTGR